MKNKIIPINENCIIKKDWVSESIHTTEPYNIPYKILDAMEARADLVRAVLPYHLVNTGTGCIKTMKSGWSIQ